MALIELDAGSFAARAFRGQVRITESMRRSPDALLQGCDLALDPLQLCHRYPRNVDLTVPPGRHGLFRPHPPRRVVAAIQETIAAR